jgi:hypothetical protein
VKPAQRSLFADLLPKSRRSAADAPRKPRSSAAEAKHRLLKLRNQLASAQEDLAEAESNLAGVQMHQRADRNRWVDDNYWQGGMAFGALDAEWYTGRTDGRYPVKINRWLRHLAFDLHSQLRDLRPIVHDLTQQESALAALMEETNGLP